MASVMITQGPMAMNFPEIWGLFVVVRGELHRAPPKLSVPLIRHPAFEPRNVAGGGGVICICA